MKIIVKNLKQVEYNVEIESDQKTIKELKNEIEKAYGFDSNLMKLLHNGVVLEDSKTLESYNIKNENVVIMMNSKPKQKPNVSQPPQPNTNNNSLNNPQINNNNNDAGNTQSNSNEGNKPGFSEKVNSLVEMGYEKEKVEKALNASNGRIDLAIEYLTSGNIPENAPTNLNLGNNNNTNSNNSNLDPDLVRNASIIKILCKNNPNKIVSLLNNIKSKSPELFNKIKQHEEEFKNLLISPITQEDIINFRNTQQAIRLASQRRAPQIQLTKEESDAIKRLKQLGNFSQAEVIQAFIACDKNEELTANFLFEQKLRDEDEANKNNQNQGQGQ